MFTTPPNQIEIRAGKNIARVSSLSAALTYLEIDGVVAIAQVTREAILGAFASVVCAPWPNRIEDGIWGQLKFGRNDDHGNALHGLVFDKEFELQSSTETSAMYKYQLTASESYQFDLEISVEYEISNRGLTVTYGAKNFGVGLAPYGVAAHPYFNVHDDSRFEIRATKRALNNQRQIPIGTEDFTTTDYLYGATNLDDCFYGLTGDLVIRHGDGSSITIWQDPQFKYLMVYTGHQMPEFGFPNPGLAIEPQTCPANAFNTREDLIWLEPGQHWRANWGVTAKGAA